jgi:ATP-dependent exoDNAse (exonuclease V) alpha subunit
MLEINAQFQRALDLMEHTSDAIFVTGRAGTGKSTLLQHFRKVTEKSVVVLAPTGVAAVNVGGVTIHSFFHFKPDITITKARRLGSSAREPELYTALDTIVIDEISMVRADLLDCVDAFMRKVAKRDQPFGGKQIIFFGDLHQLPPVTTRDDQHIFQSLLYSTPYFFDSAVMSQVELKLIELETIYRQKDETFISLLGNIRNNTLTEDDLYLLNSRVNPDYLPPVDELVVHLTTTNKMADAYNTAMLAGVRGASKTFPATSKGHFDKKIHPVPEELVLKENAQVMLTHNDPEGRYINGTMARVVALDTDEVDGVLVELETGVQLVITPHTWEMFQFSFDSGRNRIESSVVGTFTQLPLILAWAITIHKSQGKTFSRVVLDLGYGAFAHGQTYVALSRCVSLQGLVLKRPIYQNSIIMDKSVVNYLTGLRA